MLLDEGCHLLFGNHLPVDADALAKVHQMGRRVKPHLVARLHENGGEHVGDGAFAVGASHMDASELPFGIAEVLHKLHRISDVGLIGRLPDAVVHGQGIEEVFEGLLVGHILEG